MRQRTLFPTASFLLGLAALLFYPFSMFGQNVGINNSSPQYQLDVNGQAHFDGHVFIGDTTGANYYILPKTDGTNGHVLTTDGNNNVTWQEDSGGITSVNTTNRISGDGTVGSPLDIAQQGASSGEVMTWNGTNWVPQSGGGVSDPGNVLGGNATTFSAVAAHDSAYATGDSSVAIGNADAYGMDDIAIGRGAVARGNVSVESNISIGTESYSEGLKAIAIGYNAQVQSGSYRGIAIGEDAVTTDNDAIAIGTNANANSAWRALAIGNGAQALNTEAFAIGDGAIANSSPSLAIGEKPIATAQEAIAIGDSVEASNTSAIAIGNYNTASGNNAIAISENARAYTQDAIAIGNMSKASGGFNTIAMGRDAHATNTDAIAIGENTRATTGQTVAIGGGAQSNDDDAVSIGDRAKALARQSISIGRNTVSNYRYGIAIGDSARVNSSAWSGIAIGYNTLSGDQRAVAVGDEAKAPGLLSISIGSSTNADGLYAVALGANASSTTDNRGVLGVCSGCGGTDDWVVPGDLTVQGTFTDASDRRIKDDIKPLQYGMNEIMQLEPVSYKKSNNQLSKEQRKRELGLIAQDVNKVINEVVYPSQEDWWSMSYSKLIPVLIKGLQQQQKQIQNLQDQNQQLKTQNQTYEQKINQIQQDIQRLNEHLRLKTER